MFGAVARMAGIDLGKIVGSTVNNMFGGSQVGNLAGSVAQGLTSLLGGDAFGMFNAAKNAFSSIASGFTPGGGQAGMFGGNNIGGRMPMPMLAQSPQMGGGLGGANFGGGGMMGGLGGLGGGANSTIGAAAGALGQMKGLRGQMESLMNNKNMSPEDKQLATMKLQQEMQAMQQMIQMLSQMSKTFHNTQMAVIGNL